MKTKEIIAAVNNLKGVYKGVCEKCKATPIESHALLSEINSDWEKKLDAVLSAAEKDAGNFDGIVDELRQAFQVVCLTCSNVSNDDNPSNHGQTFVSLDSGNCQANSGRANSTHTDDNVILSRADWIGMHKAPEVADRSFGMAPDANLMMKEEAEMGGGTGEESSTLLPPEVEDKLRTEFSNFVSLDIIDKLLLSCVMSGMNIAEFAKMLWLPYSIVDPKTRKVKSITKQAAHARWANICRRFPVFMAVAVSSAKGSKKKIEELRKFVQNPNGDEPTDKFQNGKVTSAYLKAQAKKSKETEDKSKDETIRRLESEAAELRKANAEMAKKMEKRKGQELLQKTKRKRMRPTDESDCLPGFF